MLSRILCATDGSDLSKKLYRHAAGLAAVCGAKLALVHVADDDREPHAASRVHNEYLRAIPYTGSVDLDPEIFVPSGRTVETILLSAQGYHANLIVCGSRRRGTVASWLLGSTSRALLEQSPLPLLLVPDNDYDVISLGENQPALHFGSVVAAIDRAEHNVAQLDLASRLAHLSGQPLSLLTVLESGDDTSVDDAREHLRERAHGLQPVRPRALIVRRGEVAQEIVRCCDAEDAGLVVMGLRGKNRGSRPGAIATAVLARGRSVVLAVPEGPTNS
jgi:nucleotide-binding universal stress UspA family protein